MARQEDGRDARGYSARCHRGPSTLCPPRAVGAQQRPERIYRVACLAAAPRSGNQALLAWFQQGMRELGYVEGRNLVFEPRFADGRFERLPMLAQELVRLDPDVIFVSTTPGSLAAKAATATVPIVFVAVADPVGAGSYRTWPGGNVTGITHIVAELTGKRLELLKEIVPSASRIAVLVNPGDPNATVQMQNAEAAARTLGVQLQPVLPVRGAGDLERAFETISRSGSAAALRMVDPTGGPLRARTVELAAGGLWHLAQTLRRSTARRRRSSTRSSVALGNSASRSRSPCFSEADQVIE
jgi:putative ABC transport system substrate-binding protein